MNDDIFKDRYNPKEKRKFSIWIPLSKIIVWFRNRNKNKYNSRRNK